MKTGTAIEGIVKLREIIHKQNLWNDPNALSDVVVKLSVYNSYIADNLAPLHKNATDKAYAVYTEAKAGGMATNAADMESRGNSTDEREAYENVQNIYRATSNLITVIQSRLKVIQTQMSQEGI
jgi:hypothetical protein